MSQDHNCSDNSTLAKNIQLLDQLVISFRSSLKGQDLWQATDIVNKLRKLTVDDDTRQALINSGVLKYIVKLLGPKYHSRERLMVQCSWILSNIASEDQNSVKYIVDLGAIKKGIDLLHHPNIEVKQNAVWLLANIAGESFEYRDLVIEEGVVKHVEWLLNSAAPRPSLIKHVTWLMSNLTRGRPYPNFKKVAPLLKYLAYFLNNMKKKEIIVNSLWALSYLSDGDDDQLQRVYDLQLGPKLLSLAQHADEAIQAPTIRVLGNLLTGANDEIDLLIQQGILEVFSSLLNHERKIFKKEVCWGLSNILAGDPDLVGQVFEFEDGRIIKRLKEIVETEPNDLGNECLYCFLNASLTGGIRQLDEMVHLGVMEMLVPKLKSEGGVETIKSCIDTLDAILDGFQENPDFGVLGRAGVIAKLKECGGFEAIENLQGHPDNGVYQTVTRFIENYFSDGNDNDDE